MYTASQLTFTQTPRAAGRTTGVVVHHAASPAAWTVDDVHRSHLNRGWIGCGYHLLQTEDGQWHEGRPIGTEGAHATGYNRSHIGVALIGNFDTDEIPAHRYDSLIRMLSWLLDEHELEYTAVRGHRELPGAATLCPGKYIDMDRLRSDVDRRLVRAAPVWRVAVDGRQVGAFLDPMTAVAEAVSGDNTRIIEVTRI